MKTSGGMKEAGLVVGMDRNAHPNDRGLGRKEGGQLVSIGERNGMEKKVTTAMGKKKGLGNQNEVGKDRQIGCKQRDIGLLPTMRLRGP